MPAPVWAFFQDFDCSNNKHIKLIAFFVAYLLFLLSSSIIITAFFCITRGYSEKLPDGSEKRYGKIFKGFYFFWFQEKGKKRLQFKDDELANIVLQVKEIFNGPIKMNGNPFTPGSMYQFEASYEILGDIPAIRNKLNIKLEQVERRGDSIVLAAFLEEPVYVFPEWLRTVMAGCITCSSTVYGNLLYWTAVLCFKKSFFYSALFSNFSNELVGILLVWMAYWISLSWLNTLLWNIYDK